MSDKTTLVMPGVKKMTVPKLVKRSLQVAMAVGLTCLVVLALVFGNGMLMGRGSTWQAWSAWLGFINRPDILTTMILTALVTVLFVYWQRDHERR